MKKRMFSMLLCLCMLLMLFPMTAFASMTGEVTWEFAHGTYFGKSSPVSEDYEDGGFTFVSPENCDPYTFLGWRIKDSDDNKIYRVDEEYDPGNVGDITFVAVYEQVEVTYEFEYGKLPANRQKEETIEKGDGIKLPDLEDCGQRQFLGWMVQNSDDIDVYPAGADYWPSKSMTFVAVYDEYITHTVPFITTVALGDVGKPGETTFALELIDRWGDALTDDKVSVTAAVTTDGAGDYAGAMTITGPRQQLWHLLSEGAFVRQVDAGEAGWTYDDAVYGLYLSEVAAYSNVDNVGFVVLVMPAYITDVGSYMIDWDSIDWENLQSEDMHFTNTYTAHAYELMHDATHHWDECECKDVKNRELHKYGDWKVTREATETAVGEKEHTCTVCGYTEKAEIARLTSPDTTVPTDSNPDTGAVTSPKTGDNSKLFLWTALLFAGGFGVIGTGVYGRRRRSSREK